MTRAATRDRAALGRVACPLAQRRYAGLVPNTVTRSSADDPPQRLRLEDRPVVEHDLGAAGERRELPVPHHPGGGRVEEQLVAGPQIAVEEVLLQVLEQRPAGAVDDALRPARGPRGEKNEQRMVERIALPRPFVGGRPGGPMDGHRQIRWERAVVHDDDRPERRQPGCELAQSARPRTGVVRSNSRSAPRDRAVRSGRGRCPRPSRVRRSRSWHRRRRRRAPPPPTRRRFGAG